MTAFVLARDCLTGRSSASYQAMRLVSCFLTTALVVSVACSGDKAVDEPATTPAADPAPATDPPPATAAAPTPATDPADPPPATAAAPTPATDPADPPPATAPVADPPPATEPPSAPPPTTAMNLQALPKAWTKQQVTDYMKNTVSAGLGVKCSFCHVKGDPGADTDHKTEARAMIRMTDETNMRFFGGKARITCMTCHNGDKEPAGE